MRKHIRRACVHRSQMNPVQIPSKSNSPFLEPFLYSIRPDPHPHVPTHTNRKRMVVAAQRSGKTCPARTRITNDTRERTAQRRRSAHRKDAVLHSSRRKSDSRCALPLSSFPSCQRRNQPPPAAASTRYKKSIQIHCNVHFVHVVVVCACRHTKQRSKNRSRAIEETHKPKCTAEVHGRNKEKKTAQSHDIALQTKAAAIH
ncbi:exo-alpha-sialidase [Trypanosoma cruzi]|nr:exo-alpha-sialidase [Trypanosoma cruzi]